VAFSFLHILKVSANFRGIPISELIRSYHNEQAEQAALMLKQRRYNTDA